MVQIQTKKSVLYDARDNKFGKIVLQLETTPSQYGYEAIITDFVEKSTETQDSEGIPVIGYYLEKIRTKTLIITKDQINYLFGLVSAQIPTELPYFDREKMLFKYAFLAYVQNDFIKDASGQLITGKTIYNLNPSDWEVKN